MRQWEEEEEQQPWVEGFKSGSFLCFATDTHHHQLARAAAFTAMIISVKSIGPQQVQLQQLLRRSNVFIYSVCIEK